MDVRKVLLHSALARLIISPTFKRNKKSTWYEYDNIVLFIKIIKLILPFTTGLTHKIQRENFGGICHSNTYVYLNTVSFSLPCQGRYSNPWPCCNEASLLPLCCYLLIAFLVNLSISAVISSWFWDEFGSTLQTSRALACSKHFRSSPEKKTQTDFFIFLVLSSHVQNWANRTKPGLIFQRLKWLHAWLWSKNVKNSA